MLIWQICCCCFWEAEDEEEESCYWLFDFVSEALVTLILHMLVVLEEKRCHAKFASPECSVKCSLILLAEDEHETNGLNSKTQTKCFYTQLSGDLKMFLGFFYPLEW